jgi:hypothetical protein
MTFEQFLDKIDNTYNYYSFELRYGQTVMNVLAKYDSEKYKKITGTEYDCFYDDGIVSKTLDKLKKEWNN